MDYVKNNFLPLLGMDSIYAYWIGRPQLLSLSLSQGEVKLIGQRRCRMSLVVHLHSRLI